MLFCQAFFGLPNSHSPGGFQLRPGLVIQVHVHYKAFIEKVDNLTFIYLNARSCRNKTLEINNLILEKNADLLFISETWLSKDDSVFTNEMLPNGYDILSQPRLSRSGGGVAIIYRASLIHPNSDFKLFNLRSLLLKNCHPK